MNCSVVPLATEGGLVGVIAIEVSVAPVTVMVKLLVSPSTCTLMVLVPAATPVTTPPLETVATLRLEEEK